MTENPRQPGAGDPPGWAIALFFCGFLVWGWYYLFVLRPRMNEWLAQYISGYPAMLHVFPIIGVPVAVFAAILGIVKLARRGRGGAA